MLMFSTSLCLLITCKTEIFHQFLNLGVLLPNSCPPFSDQDILPIFFSSYILTIFKLFRLLQNKIYPYLETLSPVCFSIIIWFFKATPQDSEWTGEEPLVAQSAVHFHIQHRILLLISLCTSGFFTSADTWDRGHLSKVLHQTRRAPWVHLDPMCGRVIAATPRFTLKGKKETWAHRQQVKQSALQLWASNYWHQVCDLYGRPEL